jgi:hypothetical protein
VGPEQGIAALVRPHPRLWSPTLPTSPEDPQRHQQLPVAPTSCLLPTCMQGPHLPLSSQQDVSSSSREPSWMLWMGQDPCRAVACPCMFPVPASVRLDLGHFFVGGPKWPSLARTQDLWPIHLDFSSFFFFFFCNTGV